LRSELVEKTKELEKASNFDWSNFYDKETRFTTAKKELSGLGEEWKKKDVEKKLVESETYENSKGCASCGSKIEEPVWNKLKKDRLTLLKTKLENLQTDIVSKRESNAVLKKNFESLELTKPNETTTAIIDELKKAFAF